MLTISQGITANLFPLSSIARTPSSTDTDKLLATFPPDLLQHANQIRADIAAAYARRLPDFKSLSASELSSYSPSAAALKRGHGDFCARVESYARDQNRRDSEQAQHDAITRIAHAIRVAGKDRASWSHQDIREAAEHLAHRATHPQWRSVGQIIKAAQTWIGCPIQVFGQDDRAKLARLRSPRWWRRTIRKTVLRATETAYLHAGLVGKGKAKYVSNYAAKVHAAALERQQQWLQETVITGVDNTTGEAVERPLIECIRSPEARKAEFWAWCAGIQILAEEFGLEMAMLTLTLPPEFHPNPSMGENSWNGVTPDKSHQTLVKLWSLVRSGLQGWGVTLSGFRAVESHGDGCPHWHLLIIYPPKMRYAVIEEVIKRFPGNPAKGQAGVVVHTRAGDKESNRKVSVYFDNLQQVTGRRGRPAKYRKEVAQAELSIVNTACGSLAGYVSKYLFKDQNSECRAAAWRALWGVRGFQWFGIQGALTKWREVRRIKEQPPDVATFALWQAATDNDAAEFLRLLGGLAAASNQDTVRIKVRALNKPRINGYGEQANKQIGVIVEDQQLAIGPRGGKSWVATDTVVCVTHPIEWRLQHRPTKKAIQAKAAPLVNENTVIPIYPRRGAHRKARRRGRLHRS